MTARLKQLEQFAKDDPDDPFNHYALALETIKFDIPRALSIFSRLTQIYADYVPTYYHYGKLLQETGDTPTATTIFRKGLIAALKAGDSKAHRELSAAIREIEDEEF